MTSDAPENEETLATASLRFARFPADHALIIDIAVLNQLLESWTQSVDSVGK